MDGLNYHAVAFLLVFGLFLAMVAALTLGQRLGRRSLAFSHCRRFPFSCAVLLLLVCEFLLVCPASAERTTNQSPAPPDAAAHVASVILDGQVLFRVRGVIAYPAEQRAGVISGRIEAIASNQALTPDALRIEEAPDRSVVKF